ncbi:recombination protein O N-terminal domain-containing protein [Candidatus Kaiserbacteria bacterium]|nr:recombination protein O N-terminal domain-containing protein [Candidatus Kaiserbacteria bacterium]
MAYKTYTTTALVCGTKNRNTADRSYLMFTREAGMLFAEAKSAREERSRQRYALQDFSLVRVSLVKGEAGWRVGSIEALKNYYHQAADKSARGSVVSVFRLLRRFLKGEEASPDLFDFAVASMDELAKEQEGRMFLQMVVQIKILAHLGYVDVKNVPAELLEANPSNITSFESEKSAKIIESLYTQAITVSHL